jgi:hypothetical protein
MAHLYGECGDRRDVRQFFFWLSGVKKPGYVPSVPEFPSGYVPSVPEFPDRQVQPSLLVRLDAARARRDWDVLPHPLGARTVEPATGPAPVVEEPWTPRRSGVGPRSFGGRETGERPVCPRVFKNAKDGPPAGVEFLI